MKADVEPLLGGFFGDLGQPDKPPQEQAALILACYVAEAGPRVALRRNSMHLVGDCQCSGIQRQTVFFRFVREASEYEDCFPYDDRGKQLRREIEQQITGDAHELLVSAGHSWR